MIRPSAAPTVAALRGLGIEVTLLTGDNEGTATAVAREAGIDESSPSEASRRPTTSASYSRRPKGRHGRRRPSTSPRTRGGRHRHRHRGWQRCGDRTASMVLWERPADIHKAIEPEPATVGMKQNPSGPRSITLAIRCGRSPVQRNRVQLRPRSPHCSMSQSSIIVPPMRCPEARKWRLKRSATCPRTGRSALTHGAAA